MKYLSKVFKQSDYAAYFIVWTTIFVGGILLIFAPNMLAFFVKEDNFAESLGAFFLFGSSIILFLCWLDVYKKRKNRQKHTYIQMILFMLAALSFLWASGEEISWGQRIFSIKTPATLQNINRQGELNLHNMNTRFFNNSLETIILLLILVPVVLRRKGIEKVWGIIVPTFPIILSFQLISSYVTYKYIKIQDYLSYMVLAYYLLYFYREHDWKNIKYIFLSIFLVIFIGIINVFWRESFSTNVPREFREYLFSFVCFIYALVIYSSIKYPVKKND